MVGPRPRKGRPATKVLAPLACPVACQANMNHQNKTDFPTMLLKFSVALWFPQTGQL